MDTEKLAKGRWSTAEAHPGDPCAGYRRYGAGKLCEIMMMQELSYRLPKDPQLSKVAVLGVDPGGMMTSLLRRASPIMAHTSKIAKPFNQVLYWSKANGMFRAPSKSAVDVLRAAFDTEELGDYPNGLYMDGSSKSEVGAEVKDREKTAQLWRDSLGYAGVQKGDTILAELN
jgi:NAD(P)-dependent dehydrogenase (short-subunit alcohol dehydrogenase family)